MFIKINKFLAKVLLSSTAFLWAGCDNDTSSAPNDTTNGPTSFFDIEQELAKLKKNDTDKMESLGQCTSARNYCETMLKGDPYYFNDGQEYVVPSGSARWKVKNKIDSLLASPQSASFSDKKRECYANMSSNYLDPLPVSDYGIPAWYNCHATNSHQVNSEPCGTSEDSVRIDKDYIQALASYDSLYNEAYIGVYQKANKKAAECEKISD